MENNNILTKIADYKSQILLNYRPFTANSFADLNISEEDSRIRNLRAKLIDLRTLKDEPITVRDKAALENYRIKDEIEAVEETIRKESLAAARGDPCPQETGTKKFSREEKRQGGSRRHKRSVRKSKKSSSRTRKQRKQRKH